MAEKEQEQQVKAQEKEKNDSSPFNITFSKEELKALGTVGAGRDVTSCRGFCLSFFEAFVAALPEGQQFTSGDVLRKLKANERLYKAFKETSPFAEKYIRRHWQAFQQEAVAKGLLKRQKLSDNRVIYTRL